MELYQKGKNIAHIPVKIKKICNQRNPTSTFQESLAPPEVLLNCGAVTLLLITIMFLSTFFG